MAPRKKYVKRLNTTAKPANMQTSIPPKAAIQAITSPTLPFVADVNSETISTVHKVTFKWTINNFSTHINTANISGDSKGSKKIINVIRSAKFVPPTNDKLNFNLDLYPNGDREEAKDYISVFLCLSTNEKDSTRRILYSVSILKNNGKIFKTPNKIQMPYGRAKFISRVDLFDKTNELLLDDKLVLFCEVNAYSNECSIIKSDVQHADVSIKLAETQLMQDIAKLFSGSNVESDIIIRVGAKEFSAHKTILSARSPVFCAMFLHDLKESKQNFVKITDVNAKVFSELLKFIYTGKVSNDMVTIELLAAADKYQLDSLKAICEHILSNSLEIAAVAQMYLLADMYSANHLKMHCIEFINHNSAQVIRSDGWKWLCQSRPELLIPLYQGQSHVPQKSIK